MTPRQKAAATARKATATKRKRRDPLVRTENERQVLSLWLAGASAEEIVRATSLSDSTVYRIRKAALVQRVGERDKLAVDLREAELSRLDRLQRAHWTAALSGNVRSSELVLKCIAMRAKMLGLDAPIKVDATVKSELDAQIEELVAKLEADGLVTERSSS